MIASFEREYVNLIRDILATGEYRDTRNASTIATFGKTMKVTDLANEFPLLRGRKMFYKGVLGELDAMLSGAKNVSDFEKHGCNYWGEWANKEGQLELDYGNAWLDFNGVNQIEAVITSITSDPYGRRHIISGWRPDRLDKLSLPCCHLLYQWYVTNDGKLDMIWYQRSVDVMIGLPSDIILAAAWNILMADKCNLEVGDVTFMLGDTHIYQSHVNMTNLYLRQAAEASMDIKFVTSKYKKTSKLLEVKDLEITDYNPMPAIKFEVHA